ncbi:alginate export family protein [Rhizorhabdus wittichii]|uniref:alginate export family protein n=1 Tax=Rhizorhabdus wittichii TaxID=160791 RepID=UPI0002D591A5|nr:alginate export family protein [Rhizorhabdus wittichii]
MKTIIATAAVLAAAGPACAGKIALEPLIDARIRYEHAEQDGLPDTADALTLRLRGGVQAGNGAWSALVEGQGTLAAVDDYFDGLRGAATRPLVVDPQSIGLYRAQLRYKSKALTLTAGRQRIAIDDERFVGAVGFRDNGQTFDALRVEWTGLPRLKIDAAYAWSVRSIWGIDGRGARQQAVSGDNVFVTIGYATPIGTLAGFAYLVDQDEAAVQGFALSSQTYGARLSGSRALSRAVRLSYVLGYARQSDWHRNPNAYHADYHLADATLDIASFKVNLGYEQLGASHGAALTSFQTPLASGFKFQGWADKFLTTPPDGVRDIHAGAGHGWKKAGAFDLIAVEATWHRFDSDRLGRHYGDELDLLVTARVGRTTLGARYADYRAKRFATDTRKFWLQADWTF